MRKNKFILFCLIAIFLNTVAYSQYINRFENEFNTFSNLDNNLTITPGKIILFTGSSSIRMWKHPATDLSNPNILNRGFGGSEIVDLIENFDQIILKYKPSKIVIYSGDNDIAGGKSAEKVFGDFCTLFGMIKATLPEAQVIYIAIKPSIARWKLWMEMLQANIFIQEYLNSYPADSFVDIYSGMLDYSGLPLKELFIQDGLHLSMEGYKLWTRALNPHLEK